MCFCTESRRSSDKVLEQCSYFKFTQITSSDKTEVREGEEERKVEGEREGKGEEGEKDLEYTTKLSRLAGVPTWLQAFVWSWWLNRAAALAKESFRIPASRKGYQQLLSWCFYVHMCMEEPVLSLLHQFIWMDWPLSLGLQNGYHLWNVLCSNCENPKLCIWSPWSLFPLYGPRSPPTVYRAAWQGKPPWTEL